MDNTAQSIFLIENVSNGKFGTGFVVARENGHTYLLTCAHVVEQHQGKLRILSLDVKVIANGLQQGIDLALLAVIGLEDTPLLNRWAEGVEKQPILMRGYSRIDPDKPETEKRRLKGELGQRASRKMPNINSEAIVWDLSIQTDGFSKLKSGYSGAPVYNSQNQVLGVVSERYGGERGHAICLTNVARLESHEMALPQLPIPVRELSQKEVITQLMEKNLLLEISEVSSIVLTRLQSMQSVSPLSAEDQAFLIRTQAFLEKGIEDAASFISYCNNLSQPLVNDDPDYPYLAQRLKEGHITLCLGQELPALFNQQMPAMQVLTPLILELAEIDADEVAAEMGSTSFSALCEYVELATQHARDELASIIHQQQLTQKSNQSLAASPYLWLTGLQNPMLIIATCYDTLLEACLNKANRKYVTVSPLSNQGSNQLRLDYSDNLESPTYIAREQLDDIHPMSKGYHLIYQLRGCTYSKQKESLLLTEQDYLPLSQNHSLLLPEYIASKIQTGLWYLGHHLHSWEDRLLARALQCRRIGNRTKALVIQSRPNHFTEAFWEHHNAELIKISPTDFMKHLARELGECG